MNSNNIDTTFGVGSGYTITINSPAGTSTSYGTGVGIGSSSLHGKSPETQRINPRLYFKYVKSKLKKNELAKLKCRLSKLQALTKDAQELGQQGLYEEYARMIAMIVRESEAVACGIDQWVDIKDIEKFMHITKEEGGNRSVVYFKKLQDFPRSIPTAIGKKIKGLQEKNIFDQLWILYLDYTGEALKTNKEKIREKDPILFGQFAYSKNQYYYIADWVDANCDLTLEKFVGKLEKNKPDYKINEVEEIDKEFVNKIIAEAKARQDRLDGTKPDNYKDLMKQEEKEKLEKELKAKLEKEIESRVREEIAFEAEQDSKKEKLVENLKQHKANDQKNKKPWYKRLLS